MAAKGTPNGGLREIGERVYVNGADLSLVAYTNSPGSLGPNTLTADLVQPTVANGYAPVTLDGTWSIVDPGIVVYEHQVGVPKVTWTATGTWSAPVTGVAVISGSRVMHYADLDTAWVAANGRKLAVSVAEVLA